MPTLNLNRKTFDKLLGKEFDSEFLKDRISYLGTDLESVTDEEITVEVFPNRPDMLSEYGLARAMKTFIGLSKGLKHYLVHPSGQKLFVKKEVSKVRPYTVCAIIKDIELDDEKIKELIQIQEKLHVTFCRNRKKAAIGIYPMEKISFPITYTAKKPQDIVFQPLDASAKMNAVEILEQHPAGKAYGHLLAGKKTFPVFLDANNEVLSVPPIINSEKTGRVTESTKEFFIECSGFDIVTLNQLLNILVTTFADMGGKIYSIDVEYESDSSKSHNTAEKITTPNLSPREMDIDYAYIKKLLGLDIPDKEINSLLEKMGYGISGHKIGDKVLVPAYRADILHTVDIAEDVAIAYGYENFKEEIPKVATIAEEAGFEKFKNKIAALLIGLGCQEVNTYHLTNLKQQCSMMNCKVPAIELENALTEDYNALRAWVTPCMLQVLSDNKTKEFPQKIFDMGIVFKKSSETETGILEQTRLAVAFTHNKADFSEAKEALEYLLRMLDLKAEYTEDDHPSFIPGRVARVLVNGKKVAYLGEMHPAVLQNFNIEMPVSCFEINLTEIFSFFSN